MTYTTTPEAARGGPWRIAGWTVAAMLLALPMLAMRMTDAVRWTASDFAFAAVLIGATGGGIELAARTSRDLSFRAGSALMLCACGAILWINGAVGIVGDEGDRFNLIYGVVVANAVAGAIGAGFAPRGMMRAAAFGAASLAVIAVLAIDPADMTPAGPIRLAVPHAIMAGMFAIAALLFRRAARDRSGTIR